MASALPSTIPGACAAAVRRRSHLPPRWRWLQLADAFLEGRASFDPGGLPRRDFPRPEVRAGGRRSLRLKLLPFEFEPASSAPQQGGGDEDKNPLSALDVSHDSIAGSRRGRDPFTY